MQAERDTNNNVILAALVGYPAAGETLSVGRSLSLIVLYLIIFENPFCTLVCASEPRVVLSSVYLSNIWVMCIIAASI